jgi:dolichyl-phosphate beta-glucosyltransferase
MSTNRPRLSIVIPAYNEAKRLPRTLQRVREWTAAQEFPVEIVVVDDGSADGTADVTRGALAGVEHRVLVHAENRGKGAALRTGMTAAAGEFVLFTDADLSTPIEEASRFLDEHARGTPVVIGTRKTGAARVLVHQSPLRERMGRVYTLLSNALVCPGVTDFTCGFKSFRRDACADIFGRLHENGWAYDSEVLFLARRLGHEVREVPVRWSNDPSTRVRLLRDAVGSFAGLLRIRGRALLGRYRAAGGAPRP